LARLRVTALGGTDDVDEVGIFIGDDVVSVAETSVDGVRLVNCINVSIAQFRQIKNLETMLASLGHDECIVSDNLDITPNPGCRSVMQHSSVDVEIKNAMATNASEYR